MNILPREKQIEIIAALCEGVSIRATERLTGVHRDTIMRLGVKVGEGCNKLHGALMRISGLTGSNWMKSGVSSARNSAASHRKMATWLATSTRSSRWQARPKASSPIGPDGVLGRTPIGLRRTFAGASLDRRKSHRIGSGHIRGLSP